MQSSNGVEDNITKIAQLFPDCVTETVDERSGQPKHLIDFEKLKQNLSDSVMSERAERYQFTWPDKSKAILLANSPINATLRPCREDSVDFDNTQNLYIEGDNLDVLKCLKETYLHKVKMIYIDPPYNTGNDFVYEDDFAQSSEEYLANSGQFDEQGNRMFTNAESNGRFHTDWLNMIYPRLKVARDLLTDDGVIFISIDDNEVENLRKVCDEVFGESNCIAQLIWEKKYTIANDAKYFSDVHDYILCYSKKKEFFHIGKLPRTAQMNAAYKNPDNHPKGPWKATPLHARSGSDSNANFSYTFKNGVVFTPPTGRFSAYSKETLKAMDDNNEIWFGKDGKSIPSRKTFLCDLKNDGVVPRTIISYSEGGHNHEADEEMKKLMEKKVFTSPKPTKLLHLLLTLGNTNKEAIILDFFSGSATTAHAVMQLNSEDGGNRKFIMVQLPEKTEEKSEAFKAGYKNICEIGKERIRRAGKKIKEESPSTTQDLDTGFRVLKLDSTNMQDIYYSPKDISQADLFSQVDNVKPDRTGEDLLFQVMLELGATLDSKIETTTVAGKTIYNVAEGYLVACFDPDVTDDVVKSIAQMLPAYAVLRDTSMKDDSTATNFEQIFKTYSPDTVTKIL
ncbi:site-specific DNA-methyltransferase [Prevotella copri]|uniref:site-specific DNA-methyltransferase (adenine-specific) n=2 Tax=Segatella copri TaxID=165179 RepID=A0A6G1VPC7_9BACT|nr:site-specific DNA-methyltransferase [Segatella copri]MQP14593.1 site-specific DNA-methyltransferase [Segatella copri]